MAKASSAHTKPSWYPGAWLMGWQRLFGEVRWAPWTVSLPHGPDAAGQAPLTFCCPQLPVPLAVLFLLSKERLLTCPQRKPLLLSADELALETRPAEKEDTSSLAPKFQSHPGAGSCHLFWPP